MVWAFCILIELVYTYFRLFVHSCLLCDMMFLWQSVIPVLRKEQFSAVTLNQQAPVAMQTKHAEANLVTHCIFRHSSGHVIHLIVFYQRGDEQFLWHGSLPDARLLDLTAASLQFGQHEGAYNR